MVEDEPQQQRNDAASSSTFIIRLGDSEDSEFAVCQRTSTMSGSTPVAGTGKTAAQLVAEQGLLAAAVGQGDEAEFVEPSTAPGENGRVGDG